MFPAKKKPAIGVMIGLGPKGDSRDGPPMPPKYKAGGGDSAGDMPMGAPKPKDPMAHEAAESPAMEGGEEYGAKLLSDMTAPLIQAGMPEEHAKTTLAGIFDAMAKCLRGEGKSGMGGGMDDGGGDDGMGGSAGGY
jgi:hypothetical protein